MWKGIAAIKPGKTRTYGELAEAIKGSGPRAVGNACGANPYPVVVPCHRVVAAGGQTAASAASRIARGFLLDMKRWLLPHEGGSAMKHAADASLIDEFVNSLWLADGLAKNTLAAYRSDLALFAGWLAATAAPCRRRSPAKRTSLICPPSSPARKVANQRRLQSALRRFYRLSTRPHALDPILNIEPRLH